MIESNDALSKEVEAMRREQIGQLADKIVASTPERDGMQLVVKQADLLPDFIKDLAYNLPPQPKLVFSCWARTDGQSLR